MRARSLSRNREQSAQSTSSNGLVDEKEGFKGNVFPFGFRQGLEGNGNG